METRIPSLLVILLSATLALSACDSAEQRAEQHYQKGMELLAAGDVDRALVEFRNVFKLNNLHHDARMEYAKQVRARGDLREAYGQYLLVAEQYPDDYEARVDLAEMAVELGNWDEVERHGKRAIEIDPDAGDSKSIALLLRYRQAVLDEDASARNEIAQEAKALSGERKTDKPLRNVIVDNAVRDGDLNGALDEVDSMIADGLSDDMLLRTRLGLLNQLDMPDELEAQLEQLVAANPDDQELFGMLVRWYMSRNDTDQAEAFLRGRINPSDPSPEPRVQLVQFLNEVRGPDAARAQLNTLIAEGNDTDLYRSLLAGIDFDSGNRDGGIAEMEAILDQAQPSAQTNDFKVALARMLITTGNAVAARQRVDEVLAADPKHVEALKLLAGWQIDDDKADDAIGSLRTALDQEPDDPELLSLMAEAHLRNGSRELAGEFMSLAVQASNSAPAESMRYAQFLLADQKTDTAETILIDALRMSPGDVDLLAALGQIYVEKADWPRLEQVENTLRRQDTEEATASANALQFARLQKQQNSDETISFLEDLSRDPNDRNAAAAAIVRTRLQQGDTAAATSYLDGLLEQTPDEPTLLYLKAAVNAATGDIAGAEAIYRSLLETSPQNEPVWRALYLVTLQSGDADAARAVLDEGIAAMPDAPNLQWAKAGELESSGDIDGAIAIYESLYAQDSNSTIIANNLASLIATYHDDAQSLERAYAIARRLRGMQVPAFQDTYGWIALRRGLTDDALSHLEPAAAGLPGDPMVQFHLAEAYARTEQPALALAQYKKAVSIAGPGDTRPQIERARSEVERLTKLLAEQAAEADNGAAADPKPAQD